VNDGDDRRAIAIYGVLTVLLGAFFVLVDPPERTLFWDGLFDAGHSVLFAVLTWLALGLAFTLDPVPQHRTRRAVQVLGGMLLLAPLSEVVQIVQPSRHPSLSDVWRDAAGASAVLLWWLAARRGPAHAVVTRRVALVQRVGGVALLAVAVLVPLVAITRVYNGRRNALPAILRLDDSYWERRLLRVRDARLTTAVGREGEGANAPAALLTLQPATYPGMALTEVYPDWSGYRRLVFEVDVRSGAPVALTLRVHDAEHRGDYDDRFNTEIKLSSGRQTIAIALEDVRRAPAHREMDMHRIRGVAMFAWQLDHVAELAVGPLRLE
jgi:hypothetical protein